MTHQETARTRYVLDRDGDLWQSIGDGSWRCLTTQSCTVAGGDLTNVCGPLTELVPATEVARLRGDNERIWCEAIQKQQLADNAHFYDMEVLRAEVARLRGVVQTVEALAEAAKVSVPAAPYTGLSWAAVLDALAAAVPSQPTEQPAKEQRRALMRSIEEYRNAPSCAASAPPVPTTGYVPVDCWPGFDR
jgi:hypothetical protein